MVPISIATLLMDPGISTALTKHLAQYLHQGKEQERKAIQLTGTTLNLSIAALISLTVFILAPQISEAFLRRPELGPLLRIASLSILGQALLNTSAAIFIGQQRMELQSLTSVLYAILKAIAMPALVYLGFSSGGAIMGHTASILVAGAAGAILTLAFLKTGRDTPAAEFSTTEAKQLLRYGAPIYLSNLIGGGLTQLYGSLMVLYVTNDVIGNWGAAQNFGVLVAFLTAPISTTLFPLFSKLERGSPNLSYAFRSAVKYSSLVALPGAAALIALSDPMIRIVYGTDYPLASDFFRLFLLIYLPIGIGSVCVPALLNGQGETKIIFRMNLITLIVGAPLSLTLIPALGITGLITTMVTAPIPANLYAAYWIRRSLNLEPDWRSSAKIYASSLTALAATLATTTRLQLTPWLSLIIGGSVYTAVYAAFIKLTHTLNDEDYRMFRLLIGETGSLACILNKIIDIIKKS